MRFDSFDGTKIAYEDQGDGPVVVLLHGFASDSYINWVRPGIVDALADAGYRVVTVDMRGHGASDKPHDPEAYGGDTMARDVSALIDHLGLDTVHVVGYSMGAWVAVHLCRSEDRVRSAVLGGIGEAMLTAEPDREAVAAALVATDPTAITDPRGRSFRQFADLTGADREALAAIQRAPSRRPETLDDVDVPVLVLCGSDDDLAGSPEGLAAKIPGARAAVVGGTHLNVLNNPEFHEAVVEFLVEHA